MDLSALFYIVVGASLGSLTGKLILATTKTTLFGENTKALKGILAAAGVALLLFFYRNMTLPRIVPFDVSALNEVAPYLPLVQQENQQQYEKLILPFDKATRFGKMSPELLADFRNNVGIVVQAKKKTAAYETMLKHEELAVEMYEILKDKAPHVCTQIMNSLPFETLQNHLPKSFIEKEGLMMSNYFTDAPREPNEVTDAEKGQSLFTAEIIRLAKELEIGNFNPIVHATNENKTEHEKLCEFSAVLGRSIISMPKEDFMNVQAYIVSAM